MHLFELDWLLALNVVRPCLLKRINERNLNGFECNLQCLGSNTAKRRITTRIFDIHHHNNQTSSACKGQNKLWTKHFPYLYIGIYRVWSKTSILSTTLRSFQVYKQIFKVYKCEWSPFISNINNQLNLIYLQCR